MDVVLLCAVILLLAGFVAAPLYRRDASTRPVPPPPRAAHDLAVGRALDDLEIDLRSGLIDDTAYAAERARLEAPRGSGGRRDD